MTVTSGLTLAVFTAVNASLWRLQQREARPEGVTTLVPRWVPIAGALACVALMAVMVVRWLVGDTA